MSCFDQQNFGIDLRDHLGGDLTLKREQIGRLAFEAPRPGYLIAVAQVEQPDGDTNPVAQLQDRAVDHEVEAEGATDCFGVPGFVDIAGE